MSTGVNVTDELDEFYGVMTSLERLLLRLERDGVDVERLSAGDLAGRDLDCQNLGGSRMLSWIADEVAALAGCGKSAEGARVLGWDRKECGDARRT